MDNVIDATHRFSQPNRGKPKFTPLDRLRQSARTEREDAILLAYRLGEIAQTLSPRRPKGIAKQWFDELWNGDRWAKRKRFILFPGEAAPDPIASNGADWASLIEQAAKSLYPDDSTTSIKERARIARDVLRGTSFLPALNTAPLRSDSARSLMATLSTKICDAVEAKTDLTQLWEALEQTPFDIQSYDFERPTFDDDDQFEDSTHAAMIAAMRASQRYEGDAYSCGPLGEAARLAADVSRFRYRQLNDSNYRFEPRRRYGLDDWPFPIVRLGLVGHRHRGRIFVIPQDFGAELPFDQEFEDGEKSSEERIHEWLVANGIIADRPYQMLPEIEFCEDRGYGWKPCSYDLARSVWLEVRPRIDGSPGLWVSSGSPDWPHYYPVMQDVDTLANEALSRPDWLGFSPSSVENMSYEFLDWSTGDVDVLANGCTPASACSGLVDFESNYAPDIEGWLDDCDNGELQEFLYRRPQGMRFCPSISIDDEVPPPCEAGTIAAAIFSNASVEPESRIAFQLLDQAAVISTNGLGFYSALLASNRARIEAMIPE